MIDDKEVFHEIYVGTKVGTFKRHITTLKQTTDIINVKNVQKGDEITHLSWANSEETEILIGQNNGIVKTYDTTNQKFKEAKSLNLEKEDNLVGVGKIDSKILTAVKSGAVSLWNSKNITNINAGPLLDRMRVCPFAAKCATGGKENPLKLWDLNTQKNIFTAKNIPHDMLQLRVPIWISDLEFLSETEVVTVSRYDNVCFYDTRAQRRPVTRIQFEDATYTCVSSCYKDKLVAVGGGKGLLQVIDVRKPGKILHKYKGSVGAVKDIKCNKSRPLMFCVSLDRRLRAYDLETPRLLEETYLVSSLNCLLIKEFKVKSEKIENEPEVLDSVPVVDQSKAYEDETEDLLFESKDIYDDNQISKAANKAIKRKQKVKSVKSKKLRNKND